MMGVVPQVPSRELDRVKFTFSVLPRLHDNKPIERLGMVGEIP
jgi:hypothetical protein